ncbi:DUF4293 family protein [Blattabacterium cuenoti]|uniref:DUF4293 family protein n=1 Tax=Blattabacterium cuenoti TaxID=1653831 RepID=UPI00163BFA63|nr:DUF4293 family protein [Blattabacterium cuenoti]
MLYRIQSLYLSISILFYSFSISFLLNNRIIRYNRLQALSMSLTILCIILSLSSIILFKKRKIQLILNNINIILNTVSFLIILFFLDSEFYSYFFDAKKINFSLILFLFSSNILLYITNRTLKKEMKIIDSINRIR